MAVVLGPAHLASAAPAQELPSADQLKSALLTAADLGPGFTEAPATESPSPGENPSPVSGCDALSALINMHVAQTGPANPRAETELDGPDGNPMVTEALAAEAPDRLAADFNTVADAFRTCHTITFNAGTEDTVTFTVTPVALGDRQDAPAVRLDGTLAGVQLNAFLGIERFGTVAMAFGYFQREGASSQTASMQYRTAVAKVEHTLGTTAGSTTPPTAVATQGMRV
ncbi:hypothetical protein [Streptomyces pyridomyceticus]|uniref:hypothetical protein n=1 Tax=Streptomyces pyridomyceticus TaxID=68260 RepID=UPI0004AAD9C5|nr:hypothetical protein [Streptomyces pyridomyceticus]